MHILFLTDNFPPEVNAPASRTFEHCREWVLAGHDVTVITCVPNFPKGKVFAGYKNRLWQSETIEGIRVVRVWSYIAPNEGFAKRVLDYISFMLMAVLFAPFVRKVDLIIGTSPQFFTVCAAYAAATIKRVPWVFELRDVWPESIRAVGAMKESKILDVLEKIELFLYRKATVIVSVTNAFRRALIRRGVPENKIHVITNGVDARRFSPRPKDTDLESRHNLQGKFVVGYIGTHGMAHALDTILNAAKQIKKKIGGEKFIFLFLGDGASKSGLVHRVANESIDNVLFVDSVSKDEVIRYWSLLDAAIIHLKKTELFTTVIPSKLFECMGMAIPILHGVQGESAEIVQREAVGVCFDPENEASFCDALDQLATDSELYNRLKKNGPLAALNFDRSELASKMLEIIADIYKHEP